MGFNARQLLTFAIFAITVVNAIPFEDRLLHTYSVNQPPRVRVVMRSAVTRLTSASLIATQLATTKLPDAFRNTRCGPPPRVWC
ncbi:hypothetical protein BDN72DRAFT_849344 [Pluteus cervinus]|uniref:Uncharacterized protein n=1 Tax=Pluteus cervinus TaxID=181527 RepID=A0ACD3A7J1_9AGAR|nr:hypothetical protein BDN72DRAFT_849344 [Pluteus cervinus]